jgi:hypothetical protein
MSIVLSIFKAIYGAATFFTSLIAFLKERRQLQAGEDMATARSLKEQMTRVEKARSARRNVDTRSLPNDDPYLRD